MLVLATSTGQLERSLDDLASQVHPWQDFQDSAPALHPDPCRHLHECSHAAAALPLPLAPVGQKLGTDLSGACKHI